MLTYVDAIDWCAERINMQHTNITTLEVYSDDESIGRLKDAYLFERDGMELAISAIYGVTPTQVIYDIDERRGMKHE